MSGPVPEGSLVNIVTLVGEVTDRPFRPGEGNRTVVKVRVGRGQSANHFEFDAFGQTGDFGIGLFVGDVIAVTGRLEQRSFNNSSQIRIVAQFIELLTKSSSRADRRRDRHDDDHDDDEYDDDEEYDDEDDEDGGD